MAPLPTTEKLGAWVAQVLRDTAEAVQLCHDACDFSHATVARYRRLRECEAGPLLSAEPLPLEVAATGKLR